MMDMSGVDAAAVASEQIGYGEIEIPDLMECVTLSRRPVSARAEAPGYDRWADRGMPCSAPHSASLLLEENSYGRNPLVRIRSVEPTQAVTFHRKYQGSFSTLDGWGGKTRSGIGPNEAAEVMRLVTDYRTVSFGMQSLQFELPDGRIYTPDSHCLNREDGVLIRELKSHSSYFHMDPKYRSILAVVADASAAAGFTFMQETGDQVRGSQRRWSNVKFIYRNRFTAYTPDMARSVVAKIKGNNSITLGELVPILGDSLAQVLARAAAMLCNRLVAFELDCRFTQDTALTVPPPVKRQLDIHTIDITVPVDPSLVARLPTKS